jgi:hypothetical protein
MTSSLRNDPRSLQRPYWLLLVLALFVAGQVAGFSHWHDAVDQPEPDCALCMLSTANGAAAIAGEWQLPQLPSVYLLVSLLLVAVLRTVERFHDSRAPPALLNTSV